ncbi:toprim domain-containing protein [uncultured Gemella sp.]|uniref:toprim domain-containing protein n=1 Tax=uncultured Gemella sp. TaxID=254352 RepID=UPI0028E86F01|nr:toprim domain-containing protein [uncultured Gemella sp.]
MTLTKEEAKNMNILDVANSLGMNMLKSSRNEYYWDEHDSFKINTSKNMFRWYSKDIGGDVIQMVQTLRGVSFREAINYLDTGQFGEAKVQEVTREPFKYLLEKYETDFDNGRRYLKEIRGLSDNTIDFFLKEKALALVNRKYQDGYSEQVLVFKYFDDNQNIIGGTLQGIVPNKDRYEGKGYLKQIIYNSDGTAGVNVTVGEKADRLIFFEAPIDMMSYYELNKHNLNNVKLISMDGLKESTVARYLTEHIITDEARRKTLDFSNAVGYMNFIIKDTDYFDHNKNIDVITLAVDNDSAGRNFIEKLEKIGLKFQTELPPQLKNKEKTDWNEVLIVQKKLERRKGEINMEQNTGNKTREEFLEKLVDSKKLTQWTKNQQYYFVKGLKKVAVKLENGELRLSKKYPPKNDNEKQYIKDLLEGKDVSISEIRLQQLPDNTPKEEKEKIIIENLAYGNDVKGLNEHLKMGLKEYVNSDQYKKYLDTISKFHNYSRRNIDLIHQQKPDATLIAGAKKWNESFERYINKGEKGFTIYAPSEYKVKDLNGDFVLDKDGKVKTNIRFIPVKVFDVSQTNGKELSLNSVELENNVENYVDIYKALKEIADKDNIKIVFVDKELMPRAYGSYTPAKNTIELRKGMGQGDTLSTLIHELAHAKYQSKIITTEEYALNELHAESIAYVTSKHLGLDTSKQSFGYLNSYMKDRKDFTDLDRVIDKIHSDAKDLINKIDTTLEKVKSKEITRDKFQSKIERAIDKQREKISQKAQEVTSEKKFPTQRAMKN